MEKAKVYFTDFRTSSDENLLQKLKRLMATAGMDTIDFTNKYVAIKLHFGEPGTWPMCGPTMCGPWRSLSRTWAANRF